MRVFCLTLQIIVLAIASCSWPSSASSSADMPTRLRIPQMLAPAPVISSLATLLSGAERVVERQALETFYLATNGTSWLRKDGWLSEADHCSWFGVNCSSAGFVIALELHENGLAGTLPDAMLQLTYLECLVLFANALSGSMPDELNRWPNMTVLDLSANNFVRYCGIFLLSSLLVYSTIPATIGSLTKLRDLQLQDNELSGPIPEQLCYCLLMNRLSLASNRMSGSLPSCLGSVKGLAYVRVERNVLSGPLPPSFGELTMLETLSVGSNRFNGTIPEQWGGMTNLQSMHIGPNRLVGPLPETLAALVKLEYLALSNMAINGEVPWVIASLPRLRQLFMSRCGLTGTIPAFLARLPLETLSATHNHLFGALPEALGNLTRLEILQLADNQLTSLPRSMGRLSRLKRVDFSRNQLSLSTFDELPSFGAELRDLNLANNPLNLQFRATDSCNFKSAALSALDLSFTSTRGLAQDVLQCIAQAFPNLADLDLHNNRMMSSVEGHCGRPLPLSGLVSLNLAHNAIKSALNTLFMLEQTELIGDECALLAYSPVKTWNLIGNPLAPDPLISRSLFVADETTLTLDEPSSLNCPSRQNLLVAMQLLADAAFFDFAGCRCAIDGHFFNPSLQRCEPCPASCTCSDEAERALARDDHVVVRQGHYPMANGSVCRLVDGCDAKELHVIDCLVPTACNPDEHYVFQCSEGRDEASLMCSRCLSGWFAIGSDCVQCHAAHFLLVPLVVALLALAVCAYSWRHRYSARNSALLDMAVFWIQLTAVLSDLRTVFDTDATPDAAVGLGQLDSLLLFYPWCANACICLLTNVQGC